MAMMQNPEEIIWLLKGIDIRTNLETGVIRDVPTRRNIFRGCYDVWYCKQDEIDAVEIPKARLAEAMSLGLICGVGETYGETIYGLTEKGKEILEKENK